jgi:hypothetical protein
MEWIYKFLVSQCLKDGIWYAIQEDDKEIARRPMHEYLNELGQEGWELIAVVPIVVPVEGKEAQGQLLKHVLKKPINGA